LAQVISLAGFQESEEKLAVRTKIELANQSLGHYRLFSNKLPSHHPVPPSFDLSE